MNRIQSQFAIAKYGHIAAALLAVVIALAGFANADGMYSSHSRKAKKGYLNITAPTQVGGIILEPGDYQVREINSTSGSVVEFVHLFDNFTGEEVVGPVKVTEQVLSSPPKHTQLKLAPNTADAIALEIRGNAVSYEFAPSQPTGKADAMAVPMNADQHEYHVTYTNE